MTKPFILFITGTSASGKTTLYESLKKDESLQYITFHDIDENGVPQVGRGPWRRFRVEELLYNAGEKIKKKHSTIICGITKPHEVIESRYYEKKYNIHFILVEASFNIIRHRLQERVDLQSKKGVFDESFSKSSADKLIKSNKLLQRELSNSIDNQKKGFKINTDKLSKQEMHDDVKELIIKIGKTSGK